VVEAAPVSPVLEEWVVPWPWAPGPGGNPFWPFSVPPSTGEELAGPLPPEGPVLPPVA
jgi:hypothetical protein